MASFPCWSPLKGPVRKARYEWWNNCPIFDYTDERVSSLFLDAGFETVNLVPVGGSALVAHART